MRRPATRCSTASAPPPGRRAATIPELDGHGHAKIMPMATAGGFAVSAGRDPRGLPVQAGDHQVVGRISDMWVDAPEQLVRYLEVDARTPAASGWSRCRWPRSRRTACEVDSISVRPLRRRADDHVATTEVTLLEEDKICAYYGGGTLYC